MRAELAAAADGARVIVVGGGPGGVGAAITLKRLARERGREISVIMLEPKHFGAHYNQCMGVISPPLLEILARDYGIVYPGELVQRVITGYVLVTDNDEIHLPGELGGEVSHAVRRVQFDDFLLKRAEEEGVEVIKARATDVEFHPEDAIVYSESGAFSADVIVGAFGLDRVMVEAFQKRTAYRGPDYLETVVTKIHPDKRFVDAFSDNIYAFLVSIPGIEFGAIVPKGNHLTALIAGRRVSIKVLKKFLSLPKVRQLLPFDYSIYDAYKGSFPITPARAFYGDRYVIVGDAAGLVRPFKGKGINSAFITGRYAAETIMEEGISREAFRAFHSRCRSFTSDLWYGRLVRAFVTLSSGRLSSDPIVETARRRPAFRLALFNAVSGKENYRVILRDNMGPGDYASLVGSYLRHALGRVLGARPEPHGTR